MLVNLTDVNIGNAEGLDELPILFRLVGDVNKIEEFADMVSVLSIDVLILDTSECYLEELREALPFVECIHITDYVESQDEID